MCWSGEASTVLAAVGLGTTAWAAYKKEHPALWITLGYFSLMEALQAYTYGVIGQCNDPGNQIATLLGYLHITFQPFFINILSLYFLPKAVQQKLYIPVYTICFIAAIVMIIQVYPFSWTGPCDPIRPLCAERLCSVEGNWHIAWEVPSNDLGNYFARLDFLPLQGMKSGFNAYIFAGLILPLLYGSWRMTLYHYAMGPFLASLTTDNINEWPAVWCLLSIGFLLIVVKTPLRRWLRVEKWWLWPKSWTAA